MYLLDANIILEIQLGQSKSNECEKLLIALHENKLKAFLSDFTLDSIIIILENQDKKPEDIRKFLTSILAIKGVVLYGISIVEKIKATVLMEKYNLTFDDALNLQVMHSNNLNQIISFDKDFDKINEIKRIEPKELIASI